MLIIISILIGSLMAKAVDLDKAQRVASHIYVERSKVGSLEDFNVRHVETLEDDSQVLIYLFHAKLMITHFILQ